MIMVSRNVDTSAETETKEPSTAPPGPCSPQPVIITRLNQHDGSEHLAVNNTRWRRWLVLGGLKTTARLYRCFGKRRDLGPCVRISQHLLVKTGGTVHLAEAANMRFVADHTSIPVPRVHCAFVHKNRAYIVMDYIEGEILGDALERAVPHETADATANVPDRYASVHGLLAHVRAIIDELRTLQPPQPGFGVSNAAGGSLFDCRILRQEVRFGPFKTIQDFHFWLRKGLRLEDVPEHSGDDALEGVRHMVTMQDGPWPPCVFTHGDISGGNIMVRGDKVVSIIDWESSGWYPPYWEYAASWHSHIMWKGWQDELLPRMIDPCSPDELRMEITRQQYYGEI